MQYNVAIQYNEHVNHNQFGLIKLCVYRRLVHARMQLLAYVKIRKRNRDHQPMVYYVFLILYTGGTVVCSCICIRLHLPYLSLFIQCTNKLDNLSTRYVFVEQTAKTS